MHQENGQKTPEKGIKGTKKQEQKRPKKHLKGKRGKSPR